MDAREGVDDVTKDDDTRDGVLKAAERGRRPTTDSAPTATAAPASSALGPTAVDPQELIYEAISQQSQYGARRRHGLGFGQLSLRKPPLSSQHG